MNIMLISRCLSSLVCGKLFRFIRFRIYVYNITTAITRPLKRSKCDSVNMCVFWLVIAYGLAHLGEYDSGYYLLIRYVSTPLHHTYYMWWVYLYKHIGRTFKRIM